MLMPLYQRSVFSKVSKWFFERFQPVVLFTEGLVMPEMLLLSWCDSVIFVKCEILDKNRRSFKIQSLGG